MDSELQKFADTPSVRSADAHKTDPLDHPPAVQHHLPRFLSRPHRNRVVFFFFSSFFHLSVIMIFMSAYLFSC